MVHNKTIQLVVIRVSTRQVSRKCRIKLIVGRIILLERVPIEHRLLITDRVIDLDGKQRVVVGQRYGRRRGDTWDCGNLGQQGRVHQKVLTFAKSFERTKEEELVFNYATAY